MDCNVHTVYRKKFLFLKYQRNFAHFLLSYIPLIQNY